MTVTIEFGWRCTRCHEGLPRSAHGTTVQQCEAKKGRPCPYPEEHHQPHVRPFLSIRRSRS